MNPKFLALSNIFFDISGCLFDKAQTQETGKSGRSVEQSGSDGVTGLSVGDVLNPFYISIMVSMITLIAVVFIYRDNRKRSPWGY